MSDVHLAETSDDDEDEEGEEVDEGNLASETSDDFESSDDEVNEDEDEDKQNETMEYSEAWSRQLDSRSGKTYYLNSVTGEARWTLPSHSGARRRLAQFTRKVQPFPGRELKELLKDESLSSEDDEDADEDDADAIRTQQDAEKAVDFYMWSSIFHVVVIEAPLASFEGFLCGFYALSVGIFLVLVSKLPLKNKATTEAEAHEKIKHGASLFAGAASFIVPGVALIAYKDMLKAWRDGRLISSARVDDWQIGKIPTILGDVDARMFRAVVYGQASHARNVRAKPTSP